MNLLLSRILTYLNGSLVDDSYYRFCKFIVYNYLEFEDMNFEDVSLKSEIDKKEILSFCNLLEFKNFEEFKSRLLQDHMIRTDQIRARMLGIDSKAIIEKIGDSCFDDSVNEYISVICKAIFKAKQIILVGALYPMSITVELQTDLVTFGKPVIQYRFFDKNIKINQDDVVIFISATGRSMNAFMKIKKEFNLDQTVTVLITQNKAYTFDEYKISKYVIQVPGKFDGIEFNYQIMSICDLLRVYYYQKYYL
ncbi:MAG: MurR/RpiR family transcriptional regulator [[Clostridium] spiroforme]|uniref:MurR/RpiR family transcriptional regulator n=1 Tax=Thomasclavelia spiroformis TaxID=29348 RepID=A0A943I479_9FIRM|nr:MurR/RpiR family transcriptional regulator [Thomasclavelia spiroformis]MBS5589283.1 MurR/RpiR family transcriptional regulator [Thomasclavelia spiroformis]